MSDSGRPHDSDSMWQPPTPGDAASSSPQGPPPGQWPAGPPQSTPPAAESAPFEWTSVATDQAVEPETQPRRNRWALAGAVVGVLALGAAGIFAVTQITGGTAGGASSPEEVGEAMMASLENEDVLGVMDLLVPGERETFRQPMLDYVSELSRIEVLSDDVSLSDLSGVEIEMANTRVSVSETNVDDIANIRMQGEMTATVNGSELPLGDFIEDLAGESTDTLPTETTSSELDLPMTVVREGDRWYLSFMHTIAEQARPFGTDIPAVGLTPTGGDTPEGAVDALLDGVERLDLAAIISSLDPNEAQALQRYAPLFLADGQAALDASALEWQVSNVEYTVSGSGSTRYVAVDRLRIDGVADGESFGLEVSGGCAIAEAAGERVETCPAQGQAELDDVLGGMDAQPVEDLLATIERAFDDYDPPPGITVNEVDGRWYVSPIATGFDQGLAFMQAIDRQEIEDIAEAATVAIDWFFSEFFWGTDFDDFVLEDQSLTDNPLVLDDPPTTDPVLDEPAITDPPPVEPQDDFEALEELYWSCAELPDVDDAIACLQDRVATGELPDYYVGTDLLHPECGVAAVSLGRLPLYDLSDEEYTALVAGANACYSELIAAGTLSEFDVNAEYIAIECAQGQNPWRFDDARFDEWLDCVYG